VIRVARVRIGRAHRYAATDERFPRVIGYGASEDEARRALEEKLPRSAPPPPNVPRLPLAPSHGIFARDVETRERSDDALDRAVFVGSIDSNRRRH
jgi:hypothetical protein